MNCSVKFFEPTRTGCCARAGESVTATMAAIITLNRRRNVTCMTSSPWVGRMAGRRIFASAHDGGQSRGSRGDGRRSSIGVNVRFACKLRPTRRFGALHRGELGGSVSDRYSAEPGDFLAHFRIGEYLRDLALQPLDD